MEMKNRFQEAIQNVQRQRHLARRSVAMVLVLAMLTAMSVSWRLHQDGIALTADDTRYYCGKEEHKHTDDCYIEGTEPICGYEEGEIVEETMDLADDAGDGDSSAADWDEAGSEPESEPATQEEPEPEVVLHHHTADCYEEQEVLTCGIESDHVHQDYCYDQETGELLCTEHEHTDDCYTLEEVLVCGQEEGEPEKTDDGAALYDTDENSAEESNFAGESETVADPEPEKEATKPETDDEIDTGYTVHHHTAECYGKVLICGKEEHEHTAACLVNPNAEIDAEYDAKTPARTDADWAQDMVLVAKSQLGYTESKADVDEDGNGYTMYADQYYKDKPMVYADWDSTFVAYCLYHAGVPQDIIPQYASISALRGELARMNSEYYTDDPQGFASILPGDIVMYKNAEGRETIGVVSDAAVDEETDLTTALTVISGDVATGYDPETDATIDQVAEVSVALNEVTSFVSVNAAEGYGVDDLMDGDVAVQDMTDAELREALQKAENFGGYIIDVKAENTEFVAGSKEYYKSHITIDFKVSGEDKNNITPDKYAYRIDLPENVSLSEDYMNMLLGQEFDITNETAREGKVRFVKKEDGTYAILLKFNREYLENTSEIVGYIKFWSDLNVESTKENGTIEIPFYNNKNLEIKSDDIKHPNGETYQYDVNVKKNGSYSIKDGKLTYTVNVVSQKGTPGDVEFVDEIAKNTLGNLTLGTPEIVVKKRIVTQTRSSKEESWSDGTPLEDWTEDEEATSKLTYDAATGKIEGKLPQMTTMVADDGLSRTYEEYEVTYTYNVSNLDAKEYTVGNNVAVKSGTDVTVTGKDHEDVPIKNTYTIKKENSVTYKNGKAQITWKITANENGLNIAAKTIRDEMFAKAMNGINGIKVDPDNGYQLVDSDGNETADINKVAGIRFIGVNGKTENRQKYTITYTTEHDITDKSQTITNTASYDNGPSTGPVGPTIAARDYKKEYDYSTGATLTDDGNYIIPWKVTVDVSKANTISSGTIFRDKVALSGKNSHAMTYEQVNAWNGAFRWTSSNGTEVGGGSFMGSDVYELKFYTSPDCKDDDAVPFSSLNASNKIYGYMVTFNQDVTAPTGAAKMLIEYQTTSYERDDEPANSQKSYRNTFQIGDSGMKTADFNDKPAKVEKTDGDGKTTVSQTTSDGELIWKINVTTDARKYHDTLTVEDTLPVGVKLKSVQIKLTYGRTTDELTVPFTTYSNRDTMTGSYDEATRKLKLTLSNPKGKLASSFTYAFIIKCVAETDEIGNPVRSGQTYQYTNKAEAWFDEEARLPGAEQTQEWTKKEDTVEIKPLGKSVRAAGDKETGTKLDYSVEINPDALNLLQGDTTTSLSITDTLAVKLHPDWIVLSNNSTIAATNDVVVRAVLDEKSVKLCYAEKDADGKLVSMDKEVPGYKLTMDSYLDPTDTNKQRMLYILELKDVPDGQAMLLTYTYNLVSDIGAAYPNWTLYGYNDPNYVRNTVELEGTGYKSVEYTVKREYKNAGAEAGMSRDPTLTIKKVDQEKYSTTLPGAEFKLQRYQDDGYVDIEGKTYTTDLDGTFTLKKNDGFLTNTLYRLVETMAPENYMTPTPEEAKAKAVYFYFSSNEDGGHRLPSVPEKDTATDLSKESKLAYVENESNMTSVTVQKKWQNADGTKLDAPPNSIQFNLITLASTEEPASGREATVKGAIVRGNAGSSNIFYNFTSDVKYTEGTTLTFGITYPNADHIQHNSALIPVVYWNGSRVTPRTETPADNSSAITWVYTCTLSEGANRISGYIENSSDQDTMSKLPEYVQPTLPTSFEEVSRETYTLDSSSNWRMTFANLLRTGTNVSGEKIYYSYKVEEINTSADYQVSYSTTNGVTSGLITMVNTKTPEQEEPVYELPSTGSPGGTVPYTAGGAAIALAAVLCGYNSRRKRKRGEE